MICFAFVTAARACELHGSNLAFHFNKKMFKPDLTPMFLFLGMVTLFSIWFFFGATTQEITGITIPY
jgi:hypothetical protein